MTRVRIHSPCTQAVDTLSGRESGVKNGTLSSHFNRARAARRAREQTCTVREARHGFLFTLAFRFFIFPDVAFCFTFPQEATCEGPRALFHTSARLSAH